MEELLNQLEEVSQYLRSLSLHVDETRKSDVDKKIDEYELLVRRIKLQHGNKRVSDRNTKEVLSELSTILEELNELCENRLARLDFLNKIAPFS
tara:strand:+ start:55 stop:336 length:282 start_codon:yes stop_codon:yes gene_type:complete